MVQAKVKTTLAFGVLCFVLLSYGGIAISCPTLQLDIKNGYYVGAPDETIFSSGPVFDLYAYLIPGGASQLSGKYYIAAALVPMTGPVGGNFGNFKFGSTNVNVTSNMTYGVPPLESVLGGAGWDPGDLSKHGMYPTYFSEFAFTFNSGNQSGIYNTQTGAGQGPISGTGMYYAKFSIDTTGLASGYSIHFDLYNEKLYLKKKGNNPVGDIDVMDFAPFSHDAQSSNPVPEPGTMILLGTGLIGLAGYGRKRFHK